ncbi:fungal-specific transcription factor domain-containing protein [Ilyonectria sp. MPI-CAGE-AT-0026]|nr:fungal-specific transcription factor domain-containing protein [Ilyonectria sp. MPI-CAGE-AT-0026]
MDQNCDSTASDGGNGGGQDGSSSKRQRYTSRACTECQKRKVKCSGGEPCTQCAGGRAACQYNPGPRKRRQTAPISSNAAEVDPSVWQDQFSAQLASITSEVAALRDKASLESGIPHAGEPNQTLSGAAGELSSNAHPAPCWLASCSNAANCYLREVQLWDAEITHQGMGPFHAVAQTYFSLLHPHYPCLDQATFNSTLNTYDSNQETVTLERIQFIALVQLVAAKVSILQDFCNDNENLSGWHRFVRASHVLDHVIRDRKATLTTVQCLVLKCLYLLYVDRPDVAYDDIGVAVRIVFQLRLHDEAYWSQLLEAETALRRRLFYSVYVLERNISHNLGAPSRIFDADTGVTPPTATSNPYLVIAIKWARLLSDIWAATIRPKAPAIDQEYIAMTDAKITVMLDDLPDQLRWSTEAFKSGLYDGYPHVVVRQAIVIHLRANYLRLVLRTRGPGNPATNLPASVAVAEMAMTAIDTIHAYHNARSRSYSERYIATIFLPRAMATLSSFIWASQTVSPVINKAIKAFDSGVDIFQEMAPGFYLARRVLERLQIPIKATLQRIAELGGAETTCNQTENALSDDMMFNMQCNENMQFDGLKEIFVLPRALGQV